MVVRRLVSRLIPVLPSNTRTSVSCLRASVSIKKNDRYKSVASALPQLPPCVVVVLVV